MNLFKKAMEQKLRFTYKGILTTEDLFDLSLTSLDDIYGKLNSELNSVKNASLLNTSPNPIAVEIELKLAIIKEIVEDKQAKAKESQEAAAKAAKKQRVLEVLAKKQDQALHDMTAEELNELLKEM